MFVVLWTADAAEEVGWHGRVVVIEEEEEEAEGPFWLVVVVAVVAVVVLLLFSWVTLIGWFCC